MTTISELGKNMNEFFIIDSTLREGEQFINSNFSSTEKKEIASHLNNLGIEYLELTNPSASWQSYEDCKMISQLNLKSKILTHIRCTIEDAQKAVETGVDGVDVLFGTSSLLREFSHGKDIDFIIKKATEVIKFLQNHNVQIRFSSEDSFRSELKDLLKIYKTVSSLGIDRVGIADTVGCATPYQVEYVIQEVRKVIPSHCEIEFHGHNDTGCAIANSYAAIKAGAKYVDVTVLGIGERNGITPLGGLLARMMVDNPEYVKGKYKLSYLKEIENYVAQVTSIGIPFNNYITGFCAFTHKAGIHTKAVLNNPETYEILSPTDFGLTRFISIAHKLTGRHAIQNRATQLKLDLNEDEIKILTAEIKELAEIKKDFTLSDVDKLLVNFKPTLISFKKNIQTNINE